MSFSDIQNESDFIWFQNSVAIIATSVRDKTSITVTGFKNRINDDYSSEIYMLPSFFVVSKYLRSGYLGFNYSVETFVSHWRNLQFICIQWIVFCYWQYIRTYVCICTCICTCMCIWPLWLWSQHLWEVSRSIWEAWIALCRMYRNADIEIPRQLRNNARAMNSRF